jgi:hypothetical protein
MINYERLIISHIVVTGRKEHQLDRSNPAQVHGTGYARCGGLGSWRSFVDRALGHEVGSTFLLCTGEAPLLDRHRAVGQHG